MYVIDNVLAERQFEALTGRIFNQKFNWFFQPFVASENQGYYYFTHTFYEEGKIISDFVNSIFPILVLLNPKRIIRVKANMYTSSVNLETHGMHKDLEVPCKGAVFYVNSNDGYTELEDGTKIESVANRILLFDPTKPHQSTNCTNDKVRVTINFNYF